MLSDEKFAEAVEWLTNTLYEDIIINPEQVFCAPVDDALRSDFVRVLGGVIEKTKDTHMFLHIEVHNDTIYFRMELRENPDA